MKRSLQWTRWSVWRTYQQGIHFYRTRYCKLKCGQIIVATLVEADLPRYGSDQRCFMYSGAAVVKGATAFRTARLFIRRYL